MRYEYCFRCGKPAETEFTNMIAHPGLPSCHRCNLHVFLGQAIKQVAEIPKLEERLAALGGPPSSLYCGYPFSAKGTWKWGDFCVLDHDHTGEHESGVPEPR